MGGEGRGKDEGEERREEREGHTGLLRTTRLDTEYQFSGMRGSKLFSRAYDSKNSRLCSLSLQYPPSDYLSVHVITLSSLPITYLVD